MEKKQTAVEWLVDKLMKGEFINSPNELIHQAKEMEKEQIKDAHYEGQCDNHEGYPKYISEQYYNQTYGKI